MLYLFVWVVSAVIVGAFGNSRKIGFLGGFVLSLVLSPLIGIIIVLVSKSLDTEKYERQLLSKVDQLSGGTAQRARDSELARLDSRRLSGELSEYDYNLLKDDVMRRYQ